MQTIQPTTPSNLIVLAVAGLVVVLADVAIVGYCAWRSRQRAEARLDDISGRVVHLAVALSDQTRAESHEARLRLIRAAHAALSEQQARARHRR